MMVANYNATAAVSDRVPVGNPSYRKSRFSGLGRRGFAIFELALL
jgi:hypothetical protein